jgi:hypothetical protein
MFQLRPAEKVERKWDEAVAESDGYPSEAEAPQPCPTDTDSGRCEQDLLKKMWPLAFQEFEPVAPRIVGKEAARPREILVILNLHAARNKSLAQFVEVGNCKGGMSFPGGPEVFLDPDVQLPIAALKPATSSIAQHRRFFNLRHSQKSPVKFPRRRFTPLRRRNLQVIDANRTSFHPDIRLSERTEFFLAKNRAALT